MEPSASFNKWQEISNNERAPTARGHVHGNAVFYAYICSIKATNVVTSLKYDYLD